MPLLRFPSMSNWGLYFVFLIPPLVLGFVIQHWLKKTVAANMQVPVMNGLTGAQVAREILDRNGLQNVPVETSPGGPLSDHYDPRKKSVHLSEPVYGGHAVASTAIAAHEVGHAIQHAKAYAPFRVRSALWPAVAFASNAWFFLLMIGAFAQVLGLVQLAILLYAVVVLFQLVTLPVEFDASRRALAAVNDMGLVARSESSSAVLPQAIESASCNTPLAAFDYHDSLLGDPDAQHITETAYAGGAAAPLQSLRYFDGLGREYQNETLHRASDGTFDLVSRAWGTRGELVCETLPFRRTGGVGGGSPVACDDRTPRREMASSNSCRGSGRMRSSSRSAARPSASYCRRRRGSFSVS